MGKKRKYQLPHYDRIHPMTRNAMCIGMMLADWTKATADQTSEFPDVSPGMAFLSQLEEGAYEMFFGEGSEKYDSWSLYSGAERFPHPRSRWERAYDYCGEHIGYMQHQMYERFIALGGVPPAVLANPTTKAFAYAEATAAHQYDRYGRQAFSIMPMMAEMFENTDLGDLTLEDLQMPFDCFYVMLEESAHPLLDAFYVHRRKDIEGDVLAFVGFGFSCDADHVNEVWPNSLLTRDMTEKEYRDRDGYFRYHFEIQLNRTTGPLPTKWPDYPDGKHLPRPTSPQWTGVSLDKVINTIHEHPDLKHGLDTARGFSGLGATDAADHGQYIEAINFAHRVDELSRYMVKMAMSLLLYLNSDQKSTVVTSEREAVREAEEVIADGKKGRKWGRKGKKAKAAKERRKFLSTARVSRVGSKETAAITSRPGFSFEQPRHWRRGHFHRYWTGPVKLNGERIPYEDWSQKRTLKRIWTMPALINPDGEIQEITTRTVVRKAQEALASVLSEGNLIPIPEQTKRERNPKARKLCLEYHGRVCYLCEDDGARFGGAGGWLHVHHLDMLGDAVAERKVDPAKDLIPLCATCHGFIHSQKPMLSIEQAREIIDQYVSPKAAK